MSANAYRHWQLAVDEQGIAWASLDKADESTNTLSAAVLDEFALLLDQLDVYPPRGLIVRSAKPAGFIAGADIAELQALDTPEKALALVRRGWTVFERLAGVAYPTLALVRGHCLGGGLELALACRTLLVVDEPQTRLGLPEVMLGIVPAWGGMLRLPQRIGAPAALDLMLTGKTIDARQARRMGLADDCVPARVMDSAARQLILANAPRRPLPCFQRMLSGPLKTLVAARARRALRRRARREHYPAPYAIIDIWARHGGNALAAPELIERIVRSATARHLLRVYFMRERLKGFGKESNFTARHVHVVGAGVMGGDIAAWCARQGLTVSLQDQDIAPIAAALARAGAKIGKRLDAREARAFADRLIADPDGHGAAHADVVIEAIVENAEAKRALLARLEAVMKPDAVLATNTSSLRLEDLRGELANPARLVGIHFFNPVAKMPLVEVVTADGGDVEMARRAAAFVRQIERLPLPVRSAPGFLVNAALAPYLFAAMRAVDEGLAPQTVDRAMEDFGMPMGPIELIDLVGLDVAMAAGKGLSDAGAESPRCLAERIAAGQLGKKSGQGFYAYVDGRPVKRGAGEVPAGLAGRLIAPLIERTRQLVADGVVADSELADAGVIFGTGFAPFTGGPIHYGEQL